MITVHLFFALRPMEGVHYGFCHDFCEWTKRIEGVTWHPVKKIVLLYKGGHSKDDPSG